LSKPIIASIAHGIIFEVSHSSRRQVKQIYSSRLQWIPVDMGLRLAHSSLSMPCNESSQAYAAQLYRQRQSLRERYDALANKPAELASSQIAELRQQIAQINAELKSLEAQGIRPSIAVI
jgi:hypothetical protein